MYQKWEIVQGCQTITYAPVAFRTRQRTPVSAEIWLLPTIQEAIRPIVINLAIPGQMTEGELRGIEQLARRVPPGGCIVEAGSLYGLSSWTWAKSVDPSVTVFCIDPWQRDQWIIDLVETKIADCPRFGMEAFSQFTADCPNIVPLRGYSPDDFKDWDRPIDIFFDDALHHNPFFRNSIRYWYTRDEAGGIMAGHDYCDLLARCHERGQPPGSRTRHSGASSPVALVAGIANVPASPRP